MVTQIVVEQFIKERANGYWYKLECNFCHKEFEISGYIFNCGNGKYCSKDCYGRSKSDKRKCIVCSKEWFTSHNNPKGKKYCSQICMAIAYKDEGNPCWRGGVSRLPYHHQFRDKLKSKIRERDNYSCFICNKVGLSSFDAHVHHKDGNKMNSSEDNLTVVCRWCHGSISARGVYQL